MGIPEGQVVGTPSRTRLPPGWQGQGREKEGIAGVLSRCVEEAASDKVLGLTQGYVPVRIIGRGSFGTATLVRDKDGGFCVLKAVDISSLAREQREEAVAEASVLASLKHPYIVRYREGFIEGGSLAIVTDFAEGGDLHQRIESVRQKRLLFPQSQVLRWLTQATLGLKYLHGRHIIHRDLKSQNLFLSGEGQLRIGDFGICKVLKSDGGGAGTPAGPIGSLCEGRTVGTPLYFSPEVVGQAVYSFASDMWALGCVLHQLALLRMPFEAKSLPVLVAKILQGVPKELQLPRAFSADLQALCSDLLAQEPARRPSCAEVLKRPFMQAEMASMFKEEQSHMVAAPQQSHQAPLGRPATGLLQLPNSGYCQSRPTTPNRTFQRNGSAALLPPVRSASKEGCQGQLAFAESPGPSSRTASVSTRTTSVSGLSRNSSFASMPGSREASSSRACSHAGSRAGSPRTSANISPFLRRPNYGEVGGAVLLGRPRTGFARVVEDK